MRLRRVALALISYISPKTNTILMYMSRFGRKPDLKRPHTLNEKLLKLKLERYGEDALVSRCSDKYAVRSYVEEMGCSEILNRLIAVANNPEELNLNAMPESFVIKWNFGCGYNIMCRDKSALDWKRVRRQLQHWGREPFWAYYSELQYRGIRKKLLVESYLGNGKCVPDDYKFYCFHGRAECVMLCKNREERSHFYFFDREWHLMRINADSRDAPEGFTQPKPDCLDKAFEYADRLSAPFPFVRVDLYLLDGRVYFGEMTFTPAAGLDNRRLPETDLMFGEMLHLEAEK